MKLAAAAAGKIDADRITLTDIGTTIISYFDARLKTSACLIDFFIAETRAM